MLGARGQAFSVFKLLIAAVVAVVILSLLLSIIRIIQPIGQGDPQEESGKIVNALTPTRGVVKTSEQVFFNTNTGLSNIGIASATKGSLSANQVCILKGDFFEDERFGGVDGLSIIYKGSSPQNAQIISICDTGSSMFADGSYFATYTENGVDESWVSGTCDCYNPDFHQKCCIVALKRYSG